MATASVIILNYNGREYLEVCLRSLSEQTFRDFEIVIVDNGSTDGSREYIANEFSSVRVIAFPTNRGIAAALNEGIRQTTSPIVVLLNNDIELTPQWLSELVMALSSQGEIGAVASKMLNFFSRDVIDAAGDVLAWNCDPVARGRGEKDIGQYDRPEFVFGTCAGAAAYKRDALVRVGFFDESLFMCFEDVDLDFRMQLQGWRTLYVPSAVCYHRRGATLQRMPHLSVRLHVRNLLIVFLKDLPTRTLLKNLVGLGKGRLRDWVHYSRQGYGVEVLRGILEALMRFPKLLSQRKVIQANRVVTLESFEALIPRRPR